MSATRLWIFLGCVVGTSAAASHSNTLGFKMLSNESKPFEYYVDNRQGTPGGNSMASVRAAVESSWKSWQDLACASTAFQYKGLITDNPQIAQPDDTYDPYNVTALWVTSKTDPFYESALGGGVAAGGALTLSYDGVLASCDVFINGVDFQWSTAASTPNTKADLQSVLVHEHGHCQALDHTSDPKDVMYVRYTVGTQKRGLTQHDQDTLCALYPVMGTPGAPCLGDGGCSTATLQCVQQPRLDGGTYPKMCTRGCDPSADDCPSPLSCQTSSLVSSSTSACLHTEVVTRTGAPCELNADCGAADSVCIQQEPLPSGFLAWQEGYCSKDCTTASCPSDSTCVSTSDGPRCLHHCRYFSNDCRQGYSCGRPLANAGEVCIPSCYTDADCATTHQCRPCDGLCIPRNNPVAKVGDSCETGDDCTSGGVCLKFDPEKPGICSQACGTACSACPTGSSCHPLGENGEEYCLRDCALGTCGTGLQCSTLPTGQGCLPACQTDTECPVGSTCQNGECVNPYVGDCPLCGADGGLLSRIDGGTSGGGGATSSACGCHASGAEAWLWFGFAMMGLWLRARRVPSR